MNVLSLFDGISCAYVGLQRAGIKVEKYYASEIDKNAIIVSKRHVPCRIDVGDIRTITSLDDPIDLLVGGSPCQDLSIAKKGRKGLDGDRSGLFWEYVRIKELIKPKFFLLENVASMPKADKDIITKTMGVEPILINASLVSAQCRKRLFWTNIPNVNQPVDRGILLKDILQPDAEVDERMVTKIGRDIGRRLNAEGHREDGNTDLPIQRRIEVREDGKCGTLTSVQKDNLVVSICKGASIRGRLVDGKWINKLDIRKDDKVSALTTTMSSKLALVKDEERIRKLTPIECERLQGLSDGYTEGIAMSNRYKALGNAFHVDVIAHIVSNLLI